MRVCVKCGANAWVWKCTKGIMTGYCKCGAKTNSFKANGGQKQKEVDQKIKELEITIRENIDKEEFEKYYSK